MNIEINVLKNLIEDFLKANLPKQIIVEVGIRSNFFSPEKYLKIMIFSSKLTINRVEEQYPDLISLYLDENLYLKFQGYGGNGGQSLYRMIDKSIIREKHNALGSDKIAFRTPKNEEKAVLKALKNICERYVATLQNFKDRGLLRSFEGSDYSFLN